MRTPALAAVLALTLGPAVATARPRSQPADAKAGNGPVGKAAPACGAKVLPLVEGNTWTYVAIPSPTPPDDQIKRISPAEPKQIVITVKKLDKQDKDTVATLEEKVTLEHMKDGKAFDDTYSYESTITCNDKKFDVSPNSFFFAGEPGGTIGLEITKLDRPKGTSFQLTKGGIGAAQWGEDLVLLWKRNPTEGSGAKLGSGKLELERRFTPQDPEPVTTKQGTYKAEKVGLITTGRVTLDNPSPNMKPMELPAGWFSQLWLADGVGLVQSLNKYAHMYQLSDSTLK